jgi:hypothetical protein
MTGFAGNASRMSTGVDSGDLRMTARAGRRDETRIVGVGLVARYARALFPVGNMDIGMTPDAGRRRVSRCVWQVTARAHRMRGRRLRGERGLLAMTADARSLSSGDEVVRLVAADTRFVAWWRRSVSLRVTGRARIERSDRGRVAAMAIEATRRARVSGVLRISLAMAARAIGRDDRRRLVDLVALGALERRVPDHG